MLKQQKAEMNEQQNNKDWVSAPIQSQVPSQPKGKNSNKERLGFCSFYFSIAATAGSILYAILNAIDWKLPFNNAQSNLALFLVILQCLNFVLFIIGLSVGIASRRSKRGKISIGLALISPGWLLIWLMVDQICDPWLHP